ncbi:hypothetical protein ETB97_008985 [Aspergillus alliaceus]|uniref:Uncharacterized protein n=1 Tax=Petromyces alliaceus TaxID=209559 RepID=A0A8H5ZUU9_PETAA|nr:hypothetical protein ETB97_008985 [Aspergillus burnettii]
MLMDIGVILILALLSMKCRHFKTRYRALALFRSAPRREGPNVSMDFFYLCREVIEVEKEGLNESGFLPERSRVRAVSAQKLEDGWPMLLYTLSDPYRERLDIHKRLFIPDNSPLEM